MQNRPYTTNELEVASFLTARHIPLLHTTLRGRLVDFTFAPEASSAVDEYFSGAIMSARDLFAAHRTLRALIAQIKQHRNGTDQTWEPNPQN